MENRENDARLAASCVVAIMIGLLLPKIIANSLEDTIAIWLVSCVLIGLIVGGSTYRKKLKFQVLKPSIFLNTAWFAYVLVRASVDMMKGKQTFEIRVQMEAVQPMDDMLTLGLFIFVSLLGCLATWVLILFSAKGSIPISNMLSNLYDFGADGIGRVNKILIALTASVTAFYALWSVFT